jgi:hypothetical protein
VKIILIQLRRPFFMTDCGQNLLTSGYSSSYADLTFLIEYTFFHIFLEFTLADLADATQLSCLHSTSVSRRVASLRFNNPIFNDDEKVKWSKMLQGRKFTHG